MPLPRSPLKPGDENLFLPIKFVMKDIDTHLRQEAVKLLSNSFSKKGDKDAFPPLGHISMYYLCSLLVFWEVTHREIYWYAFVSFINVVCQNWNLLPLQHYSCLFVSFVARRELKWSLQGFSRVSGTDCKTWKIMGLCILETFWVNIRVGHVVVRKRSFKFICSFEGKVPVNFAAKRGKVLGKRPWNFRTWTLGTAWSGSPQLCGRLFSKKATRKSIRVY